MLSYIKRLFNTEKYNEASIKLLEGSGKYGGKAWPFSQRAGADAFHSWVYAATMINAYACAATPLRLYTRQDRARRKVMATRPVSHKRKAYLYGDAQQQPSRQTLQKIGELGEDWQEVTDEHPILRMLNRANPEYNGFDLTTLRIMYGELTGNAYHAVIMNEKLGIPEQLWPMPSQWVWVNPDRESFVKSYTYACPGNEELEFERDEVIHFKRPNPKDLFYGMGKVEAAWGTVKVNDAIHNMDVAMYENYARPDYAVVVKGPSSETSLDRFESYVNDRLRGTKQAGKFLTMTGDVQLTPLNFPPKDLSGREDVVEEISAVFGVPVSLMKANDPNLASARVGYSQWREGTILPLLRMDEDVLNQILIPMFGLEGEAVLAYDNPVPSDEAFDLQQHTTLVQNGLLTINEARELGGREAYEDELADQPLLNGQPLGGMTQDPMAGLMSGLSGAPEAAPAAIGQEVPATPEQLEETKEVNIDEQDEVVDKGKDCLNDKIPKLLEQGYDMDQAIALAYEQCYPDGKCNCDTCDSEVSQKAIPFSPLDLVRKASDCGANTGSGGGFGPGNTCASANRSPIAMSDKAKKLMAEAPLTAKGAAAWRRKIAKEMADNPELTEAIIGTQLFTQGDFRELQKSRRAQLEGKETFKVAPTARDEALDAPAKRLTGPLSAYKEMFEGQDLEDDATLEGMTVGSVSENFARLVENSPEVGQPIYRGQRMTRANRTNFMDEDNPRGIQERASHQRHLAEGRWLANVQPGDDFEFDVPISTSVDEQIGKDFATFAGKRSTVARADRLKNGYLIEIRNARGLRAAALSPFQRQQEVITSGNFKVVEVRGTRPSKIDYELFQLGDAPSKTREIYDWETNPTEEPRMTIVLEPADG